MEKEWLREQLAAGRSIEAIAREVGRHPSSVAYWVNKHGLASMHAAKHSAKGPVERVLLEQLVEERLTIEQIGGRLGIGSATVRHWLRKYGLRTARARQAPSEHAADREVIRECRRHGWTVFIVSGSAKRLRCKRCRVEHVSARRRRVKAILVAEAGGCCQLCGYDRYAGALPVPSSRSDREGLRPGDAGCRPLAIARSGGGRQVRSTLRELPRGGRGWAR